MDGTAWIEHQARSRSAGYAKEIPAKKRGWITAAKRLDLELEFPRFPKISRKSPLSRFGKPSMSGTIDGIQVHAELISGGDYGRNHVVEFRVEHRPMGPPAAVWLDITPRASNKLLKIGREITVGDPLFDTNVRVQTSHPDELREFLNPSRRAAVLDLFSQNATCIVQNNSITFRDKDDSWHANRLVETVLWLVDIALVLQEPDRLNAALTLQEQGNMAAAAADLHTLNLERPNTFTAGIEAQDLVELGEREQAAAIYDSVLQEHPGAPQPAGWSELAHAAPTSGSQTQPTTASAQQDALDDLFDGTVASYVAVDRFDQKYAGTTAVWHGDVEKFNSFTHDADFGSGPGIKAVLRVGAAGQSKLISNEVRAVLQLPADTPLRRDTTISFTGTLLRIDRFSRHLYIANATLS